MSKNKSALKVSDLKAIVKQALDEAIEAGKKQAKKTPDNYYKATERRLYALPDLKDKVARDKERLQNLDIDKRSKDIVRFQRTGQRLTAEEILEALEKDLLATIAANETEIKTIEEALAPLTSDPYYRVIPGRYFEQKTDEEIGEELNCDARTVRRNRSRLVKRVAVRLYGVDAI